jgi:hypothetical protein
VTKDNCFAKTPYLTIHIITMAHHAKLNPTAKQWRPDRFDARKATSTAWAAKNCVGKDSDQHSSHVAMQQIVMNDKRRAAEIITQELQELIRDAAAITGMMYVDRLTQHALPCINSRDVRRSWSQDGSEANLKRLAWMFYYYGTEVHKAGRCKTHGAWVEQKVLVKLNVSYVLLTGLDSKQATCVMQLYSQKMNAIRTNIMRRNDTFWHTSLVKCEQPHDPNCYKKNYKRPKSTFFVTGNSKLETGWSKVRIGTQTNKLRVLYEANMCDAGR